MEMITLKNCEHIKTIHSSQGFTIAIYRAEDSAEMPDGTFSRQISVKGYNLPTIAGIRYDITGKFERYAKANSWTLAAITVDEVMPTSSDAIVMYLMTLSGVGRKRANDLYNAFGDDIFNVMEHEPEKLNAVRGFKGKSIRKMLLDYAKRKTARLLFQFLYKYHINESKIMKLHSYLGEDSLEIIKENPFLLYEIGNIPFRIVDSIRSDLGYPTTFEPRLKAGICEVLKQAEFGGELFDKRNEFPQFIYDAFLPEPYYSLSFNEKELYLTSGTYIPEGVCYLMFLKLLCLPVTLQEFRSYVVDLTKAKKIYVRAEDGEIRYYRWKTAEAEYQAAKKIAEMLCPVPIKQKKPVSLDDIEQALSIVERELQIKLSVEQENAVKMALSNKVSIITGGPGTGKTSVEKGIINSFKMLHPEEGILLIAPTGRAAKRMAESTGVPASTIHKALGLRQDDDGDLVFVDETVVLSESLIIVDEASMMGALLLNTLLRHVSTSATIVFIGDVDQLPSIEIGAVLREMISASSLPVTRLTQTFRQANGSNIIVNAARINNGEKRLTYADDFKLIEKETSKEIQDAVVQTYLSLQKTYSDDEISVLSAFRKNTETGTNSLNLRLRDVLRPDITDDTPYFERKGLKFYTGDKVMFTKNTQELTNGDIGTILSILKGQDGLYVTCNFDGDTIELQDEDLVYLDLAYATTVHKAQGAEQKAVIMVADKAHKVLLKRNLLYTGVTRAKEVIYLIGQTSAIDRAIDTLDSIYRRTKLGSLIDFYCEKFGVSAEAKKEDIMQEQMTFSL